jgi:hypothetical protein
MEIEKIEKDYNIKVYNLYDKMIIGSDDEGVLLGIVSKSLSKYYGDIEALSKAFDVYMKNDRFDLSIIKRSRIKIVNKTKIKKGKIKFKPFIIDREVFLNLMEF